MPPPQGGGKHVSVTSTFFERVHIGRQADPRLGGRGFGAHASKSLLRTLVIRTAHIYMHAWVQRDSGGAWHCAVPAEAHRDTNYCNQHCAARLASDSSWLTQQVGAQRGSWQRDDSSGQASQADAPCSWREPPWAVQSQGCKGCGAAATALCSLFAADCMQLRYVGCTYCVRANPKRSSTSPHQQPPQVPTHQNPRVVSYTCTRLPCPALATPPP